MKLLLSKGADRGNKREDILIGAAGRRGTVSVMYRLLCSAASDGDFHTQNYNTMGCST